jgi:hypothetical protein
VYCKDFLNLAGGDLLRRAVGPDVDRDALVHAAAHEGDVLAEDAAGVRAERAFLHLRASDALERKARRSGVVEHLNRVPVQGIDLIAQLEQRLDRIGVGFRRSILERIDSERVVQFCDDKKLAVSGHEVAIDPHHRQSRAEIGSVTCASVAPS